MTSTVLPLKKRLAVAAVAALALGGAVSAAATPAEAGWRYGPNGYYHVNGGWGPGAAAAVGALGGLALGAALAAPRPVTVVEEPAYAAPVYSAPVYAAPVYAPPPAYGPGCYVARHRVWVPGWGWEIRRERVCDGW